MQFDWWTFALQTVNFLVLVWLLWRFLYRPVSAVIEKRKRLAEQAFTEADAVKKEAEAARQRYEDSRAELAKERQDVLNKLHEDMEEERRQVLEAANGEATKLQDDARQAIADERTATVAAMRQEVAGLAADLAADILRRVDSSVQEGNLADHIVRQIEALPAEERDRLKRDIAEDGARLEVVTASSLAPDDKERWIKRLSAYTGREDGITFTADPNILGGAELRFPHAVLKFTWADQLEKARTLLCDDDPAS